MVESTTNISNSESPSNKEDVHQPVDKPSQNDTTADTTVHEESKEAMPVKEEEGAEESVDPERLEHLRKCKVFTDWCAENGIVYPNQEYPAYFEGGLVGVRALAPIEHRQAFLKVPFKCIMSIDKAQNHPELGKVIKENPHLFDED